jgi:hypothetical protein
MSSIPPFARSIAKFNKGLAIGLEIWDLLNPSGGDDLTEILKALKEEIRSVFRQELAHQKIVHSSSVLQTARDWLAIDYHNAAKQHPPQYDDLWAKLHGGSDMPGLAQLTIEAHDLEDLATGGGKGIAEQSTSLYLGIASFILAIYRERARVAPTDAQRQECLDDLTDHAAQYITRGHQLVDISTKKRAESVSAVYSEERGRRWYRGYFLLHDYKYNDSWYGDSGDNPTVMYGRMDAFPFTRDHPPYFLSESEVRYTISLVHDTNLALLADGSADTRARLDGILGWRAIPHEWRDAFHANYMQQIQDFGSFASSSNASLVNLGAMKMNPSGGQTRRP